MKNLLSIILIIFFFSSCYYDNVDEFHPEAGLIPDCNPDTTAVTYTKDIQPLLAANCGTENSCHNANASPSLISLATFDDEVAYESTGQLLCSVTHDPCTTHPMPKDGGKLSDCKINKIKAWINQGLIQ